MEQYHLQGLHLKMQKDVLKKIVKQQKTDKWEEEIRMEAEGIPK